MVRELGGLRGNGLHAQAWVEEGSGERFEHWRAESAPRR